MKQLTIKEFFNRYPTDAACLQQIFDVRFGQSYECPKCEQAAKWYPLKAERAFSCGNCGHHLHPTVGTIFEASRTSLQSWFYAIYLFTTTRHGVPAKELERQLGVTYKTAWRMGHKIREHMAAVDGEDTLSGDVEVDETYVGGKQTREDQRDNGSNKTIVIGALERDGDVVTKVIPMAAGHEMRPFIKENVEQGSTVHTDEHNGYRGIDKAGYKHETVTHSAQQYVDGNAHVNGIENFWSQLKKGISGTHVFASPQHLSKYAKEFEYRYNNRDEPEAMFDELTNNYPEMEG